MKKEDVNEELWNKVVQIIVERLEVQPESIKLESKFIEDLMVDSLDTIELVIGFEEEFGIEIPDEQAERLRTVGDVVEYLSEVTGRQ
jgi:acyl carrier protein